MPQHFARNPIGEPFIERQSIDSTNNYARSLLHEGMAEHGIAIFAHEQLAGKGQRGKSWYSGKDESVLLSVLIRPYPLQLSQQFELSASIALATCNFLKKYQPDNIKIKWPNDLYYQDRKAAGILIESIVSSEGSNQESGVGNRWQWAIVGIGINVNQNIFPPGLVNPVSLKQITGKGFNTVVLAKELCRYLEKYFQRLITEGFQNLYSEYLQHLYKKNQKVKLKKDNRIFEAVIKTISSKGKLMVQHAIEEEFDFGEIEWII